MVNELNPHVSNLSMYMEVMNLFQHEMDDELFQQCWEALWLPVHIMDVVDIHVSNFPKTEAFYQEKLRQDRTQFMVEMQEMSKKIAVRLDTR